MQLQALKELEAIHKELVDYRNESIKKPLFTRMIGGRPTTQNLGMDFTWLRLQGMPTHQETHEYKMLNRGHQFLKQVMSRKFQRVLTRDDLGNI